MARRRRKSDAFSGLIFLGLIVFALLAYIKDNIIDYTQPQVWGTALALVALLIVRGIVKAFEAGKEAARLRAEAERTTAAYLDWGVDRAVKIATGQGWVSPHRLRSQINVTDTQAQTFLSAAWSRGLLVQAINGRYYLHDEAERKRIELLR